MLKRILGVIAAFLVAHAALAAPPAYFVDESKLPFAALPGLASERHWGVHNGAGYRMEMPDNWNGKLVMWAHGFRGAGLELTVDNHPLARVPLANGYAWAASSYSRNAYDPAQGAKDTHALDQLFNGTFGQPGRTYITGALDGRACHRHRGRAVAAFVRRRHADLRRARRLRAVRLLPRLQRHRADAVRRQQDNTPSAPTT